MILLKVSGLAKSVYYYSLSKTDKDEKNKEILEKIKENIRQTQKTLFERKAKLDEPVVVADNNGEPIVVTAQEALKRLEAIAKK